MYNQTCVSYWDETETNKQLIYELFELCQLLNIEKNDYHSLDYSIWAF